MSSCLPNIDPLIAMGINPKTGLPMKFGGTPMTLSEDIRKIVRITDEQDAVNRYRWMNLPSGLSSQAVERMLYYKGQLALFYLPTNEQFYLLPFTQLGTLDCYGKLNEIVPLVFNNSGDKKEQKLVEGLSRKVVKEVLTEFDEKTTKEGAVLLYDYTPQLSNAIIPRVVLNDAVCGLESEMMPFLRTSLINNCGITGMRVNDADQADAVNVASRSIETAAKTGNAYIPIVGNLEFQELDHGTTLTPDNYLMAMQSIDNFRLSTYGIDNGGLFEKKSHILNAEAGLNSQSNNMIYLDGLYQRQNFCNIVNSIWGIGIWCDVPNMSDGLMNMGMTAEQKNDYKEGDNVDDSYVQHEDA